MTTAVFARAGRTADQIREESRQLDPARVGWTLLMVIPFVMGFILGLTFRVVWGVLAFIWQAGFTGFGEAMKLGGKGG